jgi:hypothetical protein
MYFHIPDTQCLYTGDATGNIPLKCRLLGLFLQSIHIHLVSGICVPPFNTTWINMNSLVHQNLPSSTFCITHGGLECAHALFADRIIIIRGRHLSC